MSKIRSCNRGYNTYTYVSERWCHSCMGLIYGKKLILNIVHNWKRRYPIELMEVIKFDSIKKVSWEQKNIEWILFLNGCISHKQVRDQQLYLEQMGSTKSSNRWASVCKRRDVEYNHWQHRNRVLHDMPLGEVMSRTLLLDRSF